MDLVEIITFVIPLSYKTCRSAVGVNSHPGVIDVISKLPLTIGKLRETESEAGAITMSACMSACMYVCVCVRIYVCIYACVCMYLF